jgi:hypothetical protein
MARFGTREHVLDLIESDRLSQFGMDAAVRNANLTREDLHKFATTKSWYQQHAHNEYFNRYGQMPK